MGKKKRAKQANIEGWYMWVFLTMVVFFIAIVAYPEAIFLPPVIGVTLTQLLPTLFLMCIGIWFLATSDKVGKFGGMISFSLGLCLFMDQANVLGLISADMLGTLSIIEVQTWTMALSVIFGAILFSTSK